MIVIGCELNVCKRRFYYKGRKCSDIGTNRLYCRILYMQVCLWIRKLKWKSTARGQFQIDKQIPPQSRFVVIVHRAYQLLIKFQPNNQCSLSAVTTTANVRDQLKNGDKEKEKSEIYKILPSSSVWGFGQEIPTNSGQVGSHEILELSNVEHVIRIQGPLALVNTR